MSLQFGDFELDRERRQLLRSGQPVPLEPKVYELLSLLVERRPKALSRAQIRDVVWPGVFVSESTLGVAVNAIRQALGDDARQPRFIRTVHGFGYAFCGEVGAEAYVREASRVGDEPRPYPGLFAFTEADAAHFFGREAEVAALWEKIRRQKLLALIGPSGVGKTSFLRAGAIPSRPQGWRVAYATPGSSPVFALAHALTPELAGDGEAIEELLQGIQDLSLGGEPDRTLSAVRRWRRRGEDALLVVDQFEELFALNTSGAQSAFAGLLARLAEEGDVHVLLSLRDDFLFRCSEHEGLQPIFRDLTPLTPPSPEALRRALVEPPTRYGVRFEDDTLVEEMVEAVTGERGALPLLAFAASRLWEERDRERKLLTRGAYERIEGVAGAIAQHAEATLSGLGLEREGMVREIFRNLVTAEGTRAARARDELLSVFGETAHEAGPVLDALVDARLLTEYEAPETGSHPERGVEGDRAKDLADGQIGQTSAQGTALGSSHHRRVEIVHESLLTHWPRLVRWQTQDADGAQLRDQLRQAAHLWGERGRPEDLLWTRSSYLEYRAWRSRYPGALSALEEEFAQASTRLAGRRRRRRRAAIAAVVAALVVGLGVVGVLWRRSETARRHADAEGRRAEAGKLLVLGEAEVERRPTVALAYATKSLELADTAEARRLAVRVLQRGPTAFVARADLKDGIGAAGVAFDSTGDWLAVGETRKVTLRHRDGREPVLGGGYPSSAPIYHVGFGPDRNVLIADQDGDVRMWSVPDGREIRRLKYEEGDSLLFVRDHGLFRWTTVGAREVIHWAPLVEGEPRLVGAVAPSCGDIDEAGLQLAYAQGRHVFVCSLKNWASPPQLVGAHPADVGCIAFHPDGRQLAATDTSGGIRIWSTAGQSEAPLRVLDGAGALFLRYSATGRWLAAWNFVPNLVRLFDLDAPFSSEVLELLGPSPVQVPRDVAFEPSDRWVAVANEQDITLWPLGERYPRSIGHHEWVVDDVAFTPDGARLMSASGGPQGGTLRAWSLSVEGDEGERILLRETLNNPRIAVDPRGARVAVSALGTVFVGPVAGGELRRLGEISERAGDVPIAFSPDGRLVAAAAAWGPVAEKTIRVHDLESGTDRVLGRLPGAGEGPVGGVNDLFFADGDRIVASSPTAGLLIFDRRDGRHRVLSSRPSAAMTGDRRAGVVFLVLQEPEELVRVSLDGETQTTVFACPDCTSVALDSTGTVVATGSKEGLVRIGPASGGEPHLFFTQNNSVQRVAFSPDGRWLASSGERPSVRLWPVPDVTRTPLHRRRHEEVLVTLRSWTNLRAVQDSQSPTGWQLEPDPFPGWAVQPVR